MSVSASLVSGAGPAPPAVASAPVTGSRETPNGQSADATSSIEPADAVDTAVRAVPGVADLHTGTFGEVATYLPGRRVAGVRLLPDRCEVHVVLAWGSPVRETAAAIRAAAAAAGVHTRVDVTIEDVVDPDAAAPSRSTAIPIPAPAAIEAAPTDPSVAPKQTP